MLPLRQKTLLTLMLGALGALILGQTLSLLTVPRQRTFTALRYTGEEPVYAEGVVIRQEIPITAGMAGSWVPCLADGERAAAGQTLLHWQTQESAAEDALRVRLLRDGLRAAAEPLVTRRREIHQTVAALGAAEAKDRWNLSEALTGLVLGETEETEARLLQAEEVLVAHSGEASRTICAPEPGIFAAEADGLEELLTPENPWAAWSLPVKPVERQTVGRLITGDVWYFRTELPFVPEAGQCLEARLLGGVFETVEFTVEEIREGENRCGVLLSCGTALGEVAALRQLTVKFLPDLESGVEIPAEAVYTVGEETGVWCLVGETVKWKPVTVEKTLGDSVVVALDQSTTDSLWPGDTVLLDYRQE